MRISLNELDVIFIRDILTACVMFLLGAFVDPIAGKFTLIHHEGFGIGQVIWCAFWGLFAFHTWYYEAHYGQ